MLPPKAKRAQPQSISPIWEQNGPLENTSLPPDDHKPMLKIPLGCQNKGLGVPGNLLYRVRAAKPNKTWEKINRRGWVKPQAVAAPSNQPQRCPQQDRTGWGSWGRQGCWQAPGEPGRVISGKALCRKLALSTHPSYASERFWLPTPTFRDVFHYNRVQNWYQACLE